ncbi:MAG TPA: choice-of-anchor tandem repeat GloVer-containing protein [Rhizomicrobium sp.]|nr:choice-of-anchor tandem repeat GloVer-containing protein [Rhizomicrobium sp.]
MNSCRTSFRAALLGSALAVLALTPVLAANSTRSDWKRMRAIEGNHPRAAAPVHGDASAPGGAGATYTVLHDFAGPPNDGQSSGANVAIDDLGNIYGTTNYGGASNNGTIFRLAPDGTQTLLHSFSGSDGSVPDGAVTLMPNGDLYGTTEGGGTFGNGVLFKLSAKGKYKVLHNFASNDGSFLRGDLVRDKQGNFYGTALFGGANGDGTVFKYGFDGTFTVLHDFAGTDGQYPEHGVVRDKAGNLYGVTAFGGASDNGAVYRIAPDGTFTTLYSFTGGADGGFLYGGLDIDKDGNLYGSTGNGGANGEGTVFKLAGDGTLTTLYSFTGGADGASPEGDMLRIGKNLYSTANAGGDPNCRCGVIYEITSKGKAKVLHAFTGADGSSYSAGLAASQGVLYGTTQYGGADGLGVVFSVTKK